jgi:exodeoxyribonuclease VII small subunit
MKKRFEDNLEELKEISQSLENGNIDLNDALALYEKGMKLIQECEEQLQNVETSIKIISKSE